MPIYEYLCEECGCVTEVMQKMTEPPPAACTQCGASRIAKLVSRTAFQLKGGGWYADLYASTPAKGRKDGEGGGEKPAADKPAAEKPASKAGDAAKPAAAAAPAPAPKGSE